MALSDDEKKDILRHWIVVKRTRTREINLDKYLINNQEVLDSQIGFYFSASKEKGGQEPSTQSKNKSDKDTIPYFYQGINFYKKQ